MYNNDSDSLNAGAPDIRLSGNQQMASGPDPMAELNLMYQNALQSGQIPKGTTFKEFKFLLQQSQAPKQNSGIMASAPGTYTQNRKQMMMAAGGRIGYKEGYSVQGGVKNYLGDQEMVNAPKHWQSAPNHPKTELAYITDAEKNLLLKEDLHNSLNGGPNRGPEGVMSLNGWGSGETGGQDRSYGGGNVSGGGGGGRDNTDYSGNSAAQARSAQASANQEATRVAAVNAAAAQKVVDDAKAQAEANEALNTDLEGINIGPIKTSSQLVNEDDDVYQDRILRMRSGVEPGYRAQDERPYGFSDIEEAYREGAATKDEFDLYVDAEPVLTLDRGLDSTDTGTETTTTPTTPTTTEDEIITLAEADTGLTPAEAQETFQASVANQMAANAAAKKNTPFENYYVGGDPTADQVAFMKASGAAPSTVGLEQYAAQGGRIGYDQGGIAGLRQPYFLGKAVKKITGAAKKVLKSPIGKAALAYGIYKYPGVSGFLSDKFAGISGLLSDKFAGLAAMPLKKKLLYGAAAATLSPFLMKQEEDEEDELTAMYRGKGIDIPGIRKAVGQRGLKREDYPFMPSSYYAAEGGRIGYKNGESVSPRTAALQAMYGLNDEEDNKKLFAAQKKAQGGRMRAEEGGLMNLGGMEKDYRQEGGFVPIGKKEKADDVPARLSVNEFVFTADAVRNAGGGDIDKGAEIMENMMKNLEAGGEVSEDSQGLEGARGMFANAQKLQNRII